MHVQAGSALAGNPCKFLPSAQFCSVWSHMLTVFFNAHYAQICQTILAEIQNQAPNDQRGALKAQKRTKFLPQKTQISL